MPVARGGAYDRHGFGAAITWRPEGACAVARSPFRRRVCARGRVWRRTACAISFAISFANFVPSACAALPHRVVPVTGGAIAGCGLDLGGGPVPNGGTGSPWRGLFWACGAYLPRGVEHFHASSCCGSGQGRCGGCPCPASGGRFGLFLGWRPAQWDTLGSQPVHPRVVEPGRDGVGTGRLLVAAAAGRTPGPS